MRVCSRFTSPTILLALASTIKYVFLQYSFRRLLRPVVPHCPFLFFSSSKTLRAQNTQSTKARKNIQSDPRYVFRCPFFFFFVLLRMEIPSTFYYGIVNVYTVQMWFIPLFLLSSRVQCLSCHFVLKKKYVLKCGKLWTGSSD